jgi:ribosomal protein RSM22 (predicted rRNA methylase)
VQLPEHLRARIDELSSTVQGSELAKAAARISDRYRATDFGSAVLSTDADRIAYTAVRMPATYAACQHVFAQLRLSAPEAQPESLLDLGAGPGTAAWAAREVFPLLQQFTLVECDAGLISLGKELAGGSALGSATWLQADLGSLVALPSADLVVMSYVVGELPRHTAEALLHRAWQAAGQFLVIIEPGTKRGYASIIESRHRLIDAGFKIAAPCPHENMCPMFPGFDKKTGDWCHFSARVERTSLHRFAKQGTLGHEDEKFSYVIGSKIPVNPPESRIVRHPHKHGGHVQLELCTAKGLRRETVTRSQKDTYRAARKSEWGDRWPE